ncbi:hypothetical protein HDU84_004023 [Entophlyctis sp. JEL0112]|nr:hypothetical protein HDU84_004023 [Entophlyctis sp. JEL0112]
MLIPLTEGENILDYKIHSRESFDTAPNAPRIESSMGPAIQLEEIKGESTFFDGWHFRKDAGNRLRPKGVLSNPNSGDWLTNFKMESDSDEAQLAWADAHQPPDQVHSAAYTAQDSEADPAPPLLQPRPPALPPRSDNNTRPPAYATEYSPVMSPNPQTNANYRGSGGAGSTSRGALREATKFVAGAAARIRSTVVAATTSKADRDRDRATAAAEARAFNRVVLAALPSSFVRSVPARFIAVERVDDPVPDVVAAVSADLPAAANGAALTGSLYFVKVAMVACILPETRAPSSPVHAVLRIPVATPPPKAPHTYRLTAAFDETVARLPPHDFVVFPLAAATASASTSASSSGKDAGPFAARVAINRDCVVALSPVDLATTAITLLGANMQRRAFAAAVAGPIVSRGAEETDDEYDDDAARASEDSAEYRPQQPQRIQAVAKKALDAAASRVKESATRVNDRVASLARGGWPSTFAVHVAADYLAVLRALDPEAVSEKL